MAEVGEQKDIWPCIHCKGPIRIKEFGRDLRWYNARTGAACPVSNGYHEPDQGRTLYVNNSF